MMTDYQTANRRGIWRRVARAITHIGGTSVLAVSLAMAQRPTHSLTAAEQAHGIRLYQWSRVITGQDASLNAPDAKEELATRAAQWVQALRQTTSRGIQLDAAGEVSVAAGDLALARKQFAERLASPKLSTEDRGYTLVLAVSVFGQDPRDTMRMRIAHEYLATLDALSDSSIIFKYRAYATLGQNYFEADQSQEGIAHLLHAYSLLPRVPFDRIGPFGPVNPFDPFVPLANMLAGRPNGRAQIDSLGRWVQKYIDASPALVAKDSANYWRGRFNRDAFNNTLSLVAHLGTESPPITGHVWWNTATPTTPSSDDSAARVLPLNDGKIRIIEFGDNRCGACMATLPKIDKLRKEMPSNVEVWYVTFGFGTWGADSVNRTQEADLMRRYYLEHRKLGLSIAVWLGNRVDDINGGTYPQPHPTFRSLGLLGRPWILITDGRGHVRQLNMGYREEHVRRMIRLLEAESMAGKSS